MAQNTRFSGATNDGPSASSNVHKAGPNHPATTEELTANEWSLPRRNDRRK
jgi:hypothetical protein